MYAQTLKLTKSHSTDGLDIHMDRDSHMDNCELTLIGRCNFSVPTLGSWLQLGTIPCSQHFWIQTIDQGTWKGVNLWLFSIRLSTVQAGSSCYNKTTTRGGALNNRCWFLTVLGWVRALVDSEGCFLFLRWCLLVCSYEKAGNFLGAFL